MRAQKGTKKGASAHTPFRWVYVTFQGCPFWVQKLPFILNNHHIYEYSHVVTVHQSIRMHLATYRTYDSLSKVLLPRWNLGINYKILLLTIN